MRYPLYNLHDEEFEKLVILICEKILGTGTINFSTGQDGGRDAKFTGTAKKFPSEITPWFGKFIIQAKHTTRPNASCSDSNFKTILKNEVQERLKKLTEQKKVDYYLLFTNRKLSGNMDSKIEDLINKDIGVTNQVLGEERIQLWLEENTEIVKTLSLNKLLLPLEFYEADIREVILTFSKADFSKNIIREIELDSSRISIEKKNELNKLSEDYFISVFKSSYNEFGKIETFLKDPKNEKLKNYYNNTVADLNEEITIHRADYYAFEEIFNFLYKQILDTSNQQLINKRNLIRVFLHYMYHNCEIGKKE